MTSVWSAVFAWIWVKSERQRSCQEDLNLILLTLYKVCSSLAWDYDRERAPFSAIFQIAKINSALRFKNICKVIIKHERSALLRLRMPAMDCERRTRSSLQDIQSRLSSYKIHTVSRNDSQMEFSWIPLCSLEKFMNGLRNRRGLIKLLTCEM